MVSITFSADGVPVSLNFLVKWNWDVYIALKHALIQASSDVPVIHPQ
jgi:hypothetical protein